MIRGFKVPECCDVCHSKDLFNSETGYCMRCKIKSIREIYDDDLIPPPQRISIELIIQLIIPAILFFGLPVLYILSLIFPPLGSLLHNIPGPLFFLIIAAFYILLLAIFAKFTHWF
jgi:hypothetical protein